MVTKKSAKSTHKAISKVIKQEISYAMEMYKNVFLLEDASTFHKLLIDFKNDRKKLTKSEDFFILLVTSYLKKKGISIDDMLQNKDLFMTFETKQNEGSFFTPLRWAREAHKLIIDRVGLENLKDYHVWDSSCGSGNLLVEFPECKHLWLSTLNGEDIPIVNERLSKTRHKDNFTAFQLDFLSASDTTFLEGFTMLLPEGLQTALRNNEKIAIVINPPYSVRGTDTFLGDLLQKEGLTDMKTDLFRQFIWQVINLVKYHNLTNVEFVLMVTGGIHITKTSQKAVELLDETFNYRGGFLYPAREFEGVSDSFEWAISTTHWGISSGEEKYYTDVLELDTRRSTNQTEKVYDYDGEFLREDRVIEDTGVTHFTKQVQSKLWDWLENGVKFDKDTSFAKINSYGDKLVDDNEVIRASSEPWFYLYGRDTLRDAPMYVTTQTTPVYTGDIGVKEHNLDRVIWYVCYVMRMKTWDERSYQRLMPPILDDFFYNEFLPNAYLTVFMSRINLTYAVRSLRTFGGEVSYVNATFPLTKEETLECIKDEKVLEDFNKFYKNFDFIQEKMNWAYENAHPVIKESWDKYKGIYKKFLENRIVDDLEPLTSAFDLNFSQIRRLKNFTKEDEQLYKDLLEKSWNVMRGIQLGLNFDYCNPNASD